MKYIKILLKALVELAESGFAAMKDGKFSGFKDLMQFADDVPEVVEVIKNGKEVLESIPLLLDPEKRQEAIDYLEKVHVNGCPPVSEAQILPRFPFGFIFVPWMDDLRIASVEPDALKVYLNLLRHDPPPVSPLVIPVTQQGRSPCRTPDVF